MIVIVGIIVGIGEILCTFLKFCTLKSILTVDFTNLNPSMYVAVMIAHFSKAKQKVEYIVRAIESFFKNVIHQNFVCLTAEF